MEKRDANVSFYKAGNGIGTRITLPMPWLRDMEVTAEDKQIELTYDETTKTITIKKK